MNYTNEAWEEEQMSNLGCESVGDLIAEVKRLRELADNLYDFAKWMQDEKRKDPVGLEVLKDRMYWRDD